MKIGICIPSRGDMAIGTAFDLAVMTAYDQKHRKGDIGVYTVNGTLIFDQREKLAESALADGCEYVLWVDADMRFPKNTLEVLLSRKRDIVGANATTRTIPVKACAKNLHIDLENKTNTWTSVSSYKKKGIERVTATGCGVMLVHRKVFEGTPKPWFWFYQIPGGKVLGEDVHFCVAAHDAGFETWIDHDLSQVIGHVGEYTYGWKDITDESDELQRPKD